MAGFTIAFLDVGERMPKACGTMWHDSWSPHHQATSDNRRYLSDNLGHWGPALIATSRRQIGPIPSRYIRPPVDGLDRHHQGTSDVQLDMGNRLHRREPVWTATSCRWGLRGCGRWFQARGQGCFRELNTKENRAVYYVVVVLRRREFNEISNSNHHHHLAVACLYVVNLSGLNDHHLSQ